MSDVSVLDTGTLVEASVLASPERNETMVVFDIETMGNPGDVIEFMPEFSAPSNWKDEEKIAAIVAEQKEKWLDEIALDPDLGKIRAIGFAYLEQSTVVPASFEPEILMGNEEKMLGRFWTLAVDANLLVGYNILNFDFLYLLRRTMALGLRVAGIPNLRRYQTRPIRDLYGILYNWSSGKSLEWVAKRYGLKASPKWFEQSGADSLDMNDEELREYLMTNVHVTWQLHERMRGVYF